MYTMRFDLRSSAAADPATIYGAALDMAAWGEAHGCLAAIISEHHGVEDGYLPSPFVIAGAMAARTSRLAIMAAAALLPFYDPVRVAEDLLVLDVLSRGRVSAVFGLGYRPEEFALYGVEMADRAALVEAHLAVLLTALREGRVDAPGRTGIVRPHPFTPGGPRISYGGGSPAAARRAARFGLDFMGQRGDETLRAAYLAEAARVGVAPGNVMLPSAATPTVLFVADDVERAWDELGVYLLHDAVEYAAWNPGDETTVSLSRATTVDELRAEAGAYRIVSLDDGAAMFAASGYLGLHPLCGGIPPETAWRYLHHAARCTGVAV